jgi:general secretion pathway protein I
MKTNRKTKGFTLLEVIVSLAIVTIALSAIITISSSRADTLIELKERNRALLVANNVLEKYYIEELKVGVYDGKQQNGNHDWNWQVKVSQTNNEMILRLDVKVSKDSDFDYSQAQLVGFKGN